MPDKDSREHKEWLLAQSIASVRQRLATPALWAVPANQGGLGLRGWPGPEAWFEGAPLPDPTDGTPIPNWLDMLMQWRDWLADYTGSAAEAGAAEGFVHAILDVWEALDGLEKGPGKRLEYTALQFLQEASRRLEHAAQHCAEVCDPHGGSLSSLDMAPLAGVLGQPLVHAIEVFRTDPWWERLGEAVLDNDRLWQIFNDSIHELLQEQGLAGYDEEGERTPEMNCVEAAAMRLMARNHQKQPYATVCDGMVELNRNRKGPVVDGRPLLSEGAGLSSRSLWGHPARYCTDLADRLLRASGASNEEADEFADGLAEEVLAHLPDTDTCFPKSVVDRYLETNRAHVKAVTTALQGADESDEPAPGA